MRRAIAPLILLLFLLAGCELEKYPADQPLDPSLQLTDGFCLLSRSRVVLNHYDIEYYDYGAHLIYLKSPESFEEDFQEPGAAAVYADSTRIYDLSLVSMVSSYMPQGPIIWFPFIFYPDYIVGIEYYLSYEQMAEGCADIRDDPRIVEALKKYGQFRNGLQCEIVSFQYSSPDDVVLELELWNEDSLNYYYWDPEKFGMGLYHYVTNGLTLWDADARQTYTHQIEHIQPDPWDSRDLEWMSLLESDSSVRLSIAYDHFDTVPPGSYTAIFHFPAPQFRIDREDLEQQNGRIWLGDLQLYSEVVVE